MANNRPSAGDFRGMVAADASRIESPPAARSFIGSGKSFVSNSKVILWGSRTSLSMLVPKRS